VHISVGRNQGYNDQRINETQDPSPFFGANLNYDNGAREDYSKPLSAWCNSVSPPPSQPYNLTASATGQTSIHLTWQETDSVDSFRIYRDNAVPQSLLGSVSGSERQFDDNNNDLRCGTPYWYHVSAVKNGVESNRGDVSARTANCPTSNPTNTPQPSGGNANFTLTSPSYNVQTNQQVNVIIHLHVNSGQFSESHGDLLHGYDPTYGAWPVQPIKGTVGAGQDFDFNFTMTAPGSSGQYTSRWQMWVGGNAIGNPATVTLNASSPPPPPPPAGNMHVEYFRDTGLGDRCYEGYENSTYVSKDWGDGAPNSNCPVDHFGARFTETLSFPGGQYRFHCQHDDACRIYIDGDKKLDELSSGGHDWYGNVSAGNHEVKVEYYDNTGGAHIDAWWQGPGYLPSDQDCSTAPTQWCAWYWLNRTLSGTPAVIQLEGDPINHAWNGSSPFPAFPSTNFSARFTRQAAFDCGTYRFHVFADDGVRLYIDDVLQPQFDQWHDPSAAHYYGDIVLTSGTHNLRVEYYQAAGWDGLQVDWAKTSDVGPSCATATPTATPTTTATATPTDTATSTPTPMPSLDGTQVTVPANQAWTDTGIQAPSYPATGFSYRMTAWGTLQIAGRNTGPDGTLSCTAGSDWVAPGLPCHALIGKFGSNGTPFFIGSISRSGDMTPLPTGTNLYLGVNDQLSDLSQSTGAWTVNVAFTTDGYWPTNTPTAASAGVTMTNVLPQGDSEAAGATFNPSVTVQTSGFSLDCSQDSLQNQDGNLFGAWPNQGCVSLGNNQYQFSFGTAMTAPTTPGVYHSQWQVWHYPDHVGPVIDLFFVVPSNASTTATPPSSVTSTPTSATAPRATATPTTAPTNTGQPIPTNTPSQTSIPTTAATTTAVPSTTATATTTAGPSTTATATTQPTSTATAALPTTPSRSTATVQPTAVPSSTNTAQPTDTSIPLPTTTTQAAPTEQPKPPTSTSTLVPTSVPPAPTSIPPAPTSVPPSSTMIPNPTVPPSPTTVPILTVPPSAPTSAPIAPASTSTSLPVTTDILPTATTKPAQPPSNAVPTATPSVVTDTSGGTVAPPPSTQQHSRPPTTHAMTLPLSINRVPQQIVSGSTTTIQIYTIPRAQIATLVQVMV